MTENTSISRIPSELPHMRVFSLFPDTEFMVFFAATQGDLPDDSVRRELRVLAIHDRADQKRSVVGTVVTDVISGAIGGGTWAAIAATYTALAKHLKRSHGTAPADARTVVQRLTEASGHILGPEPPTLDNLRLKQLEDKRWEAQFTCRGIGVRATLDPSAALIKWSQTNASKSR